MAIPVISVGAARYWAAREPRRAGMSIRRSLQSRIVNLLGAVVALALVMMLILAPGSALAANGGKLSKHDRELLAEARAQGQPTVTLLIAAKPGANKTVAN